MAKPGYRLAVLATLLALLVVLLGAYTRLTHAGLGCPDWPGCYGFITVPSSDAQLAHAQAHFPEHPVQPEKGWSEMIHRYCAGSLALLVGLLAMQAWRRHGRDGQPYRLPLILLGVVVAQAAFGMWTVTLKLWPQVVTSHLLGGFATLSLLFLLSLRLSAAFAPLPGVTPRLRRWALLSLGLVVGQIALGGWVSSNYAAMACTDFPLCQGQWLPDADFANGFHLTQHIGPDYLGGHLDSEARTAIHLTHRAGACLLSLALLGLAWHLRGEGQGRMGAAVLAALALQVTLGISNVVLHLPLAVAVAHNAGGAILLMTLIAVNYRLRALPVPRAVVQRRHWRPHLPVLWSGK
ncbi:cytochrome oxidase assembly [Pseudomonas sp. M47T1]|uniref:COX15/CtaA family protein n=1 Tax=unclassified Pseudomonas TaxID=196821 RepID=UPI00026087D3|nr:COX15/CtaA family protein [Pseudomonas sp. M47T1]EIK97572.1 cytochrome oxidase assembly [Pseudomonas sp. M47T1]